MAKRRDEKYKFKGQCCIMYVKLIDANNGSVNFEEKERTRLVSKTKDMSIKSVKIGTRSQTSEVNNKEVVSKDIIADTHISDPRMLTEFLIEPLFDLYMDRITPTSIDSPQAPNTRVSMGICQNISLSEIKQLESNWSDGTSTRFTDACKVISEDSTNDPNPNGVGAYITVSLYHAVDAIQKSDVINDSTNSLGSLDVGTGSPNSAEQVAKFEFVRTQMGTDAFKNKIKDSLQISDADWATLLSNAHGIKS